MEGKLILEPSGQAFEQKGVLNPAVIFKDGELLMFYRAIANDDVSSIGFCRLVNNEVVERWNTPIMRPEFEYEKMGMEDPRITFLDGVYYMMYTAYDGLNARVAYAVSTDLKSWQKKGLLTPAVSYDEAEDIFKQSGVLDIRYKFYERMYRGIHGDAIMLWEKDMTLFPKKNSEGMMMLLHRVLPGIQICYCQDLEQLNENYWRHYYTHLNDYLVMDPQLDFESACVGAGCPPLETEKGWLLIYHAVSYSETRGKVYRAGAVLLDRNNPQTVLGKLNQPLFEPEANYEIKGNVDNVVFPTGAYVEKGILYIYYGCADKNIGVKWMSLEELLSRFV